MKNKRVYLAVRLVFVRTGSFSWWLVLAFSVLLLAVHFQGAYTLVPTEGIFVSVQDFTPTTASFASHNKFAPPLLALKTHLDMIIKQTSAPLKYPQL